MCRPRREPWLQFPGQSHGMGPSILIAMGYGCPPSWSPRMFNLAPCSEPLPVRRHMIIPRSWRRFVIGKTWRAVPGHPSCPVLGFSMPRRCTPCSHCRIVPRTRIGPRLPYLLGEPSLSLQRSWRNPSLTYSGACWWGWQTNEIMVSISEGQPSN